MADKEQTQRLLQALQDKLNIKAIDAIKKGADVNAKTQIKNTPMIYCAFNNNVLVAKELLKKGANLDSKNSSNETALMFAIRSKSPDMIDFLLENKADVNIKNNSGENALFTSVIFKDEKTAKKLLQAGVDVTTKNKDGLKITDFHMSRSLKTAIHNKINNKDKRLNFGKKKKKGSKILVEVLKKQSKSK